MSGSKREEGWPECEGKTDQALAIEAPGMSAASHPPLSEQFRKSLLYYSGFIRGIPVKKAKGRTRGKTLDYLDLWGIRRRRNERALSEKPRQGQKACGRLDLPRGREDDLTIRSRAARWAKSASRLGKRTLLRDSARRDEHVDDYQRTAAWLLALYIAAGRGGGSARSSRARPRTTSSRNTFRAAPMCSRRAPRCG